MYTARRKRVTPKPSLLEGVPLPLDRPRGDFVETYWSMEMLLGLAIDIFDSR